MEKIQLAYRLPKMSVIAITMFYRSKKAMVHSSDENPDFFDIVVGLLQGVILVLYFLIFCQYN